MGSLQPAQSVLHYRIVEKIGQGGMGEIYQADDLKLGRRVAIKLLPPDTAQDVQAKERFLREARAASALNHPNIVIIHAIEESDGLNFIVMEYVEGESLWTRILRGPIELTQVLDWGVQIADALDAAHAVGLIHRDIKCSNILITPRGQAKVLDFGLAKMIGPMPSDSDTAAVTMLLRLTSPEVIVGTVDYMSPEQVRGEALDGRSDIFSLGIVLYQAAAGILPFNGPSVISIMHEITAVDPRPPSAIKRDLPREFDLIIERALAKDRERRYAAGAALADEVPKLRGPISAKLSGIAATVEPAGSGT